MSNTTQWRHSTLYLVSVHDTLVRDTEGVTINAAPFQQVLDVFEMQTLFTTLLVDQLHFFAVVIVGPCTQV